MNAQILKFALCACLLMLLAGCKTDNQVTEAPSIEKIVIRIPEDVDALSPMHSRSSYAREIYTYLYLSLADYDYETLELKPMLIEEIPTPSVSQIDGVDYAEIPMRIRTDAVWGDQTPITGYDVAFTVAIPLHPSIKSGAWKYLAGQIKEIKVDPSDPKSFTMIAKVGSFRYLEELLSIQIYPKHLSDPDGDISKYTQAQLKEGGDFQSNPDFLSIGETFNALHQSEPAGSGPYFLENREEGQFIVLKQKENYWGDNYPDLDQLESLPDRIIFQIIKDEATAATLFKNGELDFSNMSRAPYQSYDDMKATDSADDNMNFDIIQIPRYLFLRLNNEDPRLADRSVRQALNHLTDVDRIISQLEGGYASRTNSIILPYREYYNKNLVNPDFNIEKAKTILDNARWIDHDGDGIREKTINGKKEKLDLRFFISGSPPSTAISTILKNACDQAGINIDIVTKGNRATYAENLVPGDYEINIGVVTQYPVKEDPFMSWHSTAIGTNGRNITRYNNPKADIIMEQLRQANQTEAKQKELYLELQQVMSEDYPVVFLFSPQMRVVTSDRLTPVYSQYNPGYYVNAAIEE